MSTLPRLSEPRPEKKRHHGRAWYRRLSGVTATLLILPCKVDAQEPDPQVVQADLAVNLHSPRGEPQLGAGYTTLLELRTMDTLGDRLNHSIGVGAAGIVSTALPAGMHAKSAQAARFGMEWHLAGGESGFDGLFHVDFGHGVRWPSEGHGFVLRGGADLKFAGNRQYYVSVFDAPNLDLGYQYIAYQRLLEFSFRTSLLWDGRYRFEHSLSKNLPTTIGWGPLLELGTSRLWMSLQFLRGGGLSQVNADLCSRPGGAWSLCIKLAEVSDAWPTHESKHRLRTGIFGVGWAPTGS